MGGWVGIKGEKKEDPGTPSMDWARGISNHMQV